LKNKRVELVEFDVRSAESDSVLLRRVDIFRFKVNMYKMREERDIEPETFANLVASSLYERRLVARSAWNSNTKIRVISRGKRAI
jgi:hypothetical protein